MAELIASGTTTAQSADFDVEAGASASLFLKSASSQTLPYDALAIVQVKSADATYFDVGVLTATDPMKVLQAAGTFRVSRVAASSAYGVDKV